MTERPRAYINRVGSLDRADRKETTINAEVNNTGVLLVVDIDGVHAAFIRVATEALMRFATEAMEIERQFYIDERKRRIKEDRKHEIKATRKKK